MVLVAAEPAMEVGVFHSPAPQRLTARKQRVLSKGKPHFASPAMGVTTSDAPGSVGRKRKSLGASPAKPLGDCSVPSTPASASASATKKKRARMSIGTPGKATPLDGAREQDVAKRFVELEVSEVYKAIRKQTGSLGGNAAGGAIYGEITQASFQRVVDYLKENCELTADSRFLDVGSGLGKPNFHVAIDPGVQVSYGVELEELRWHLSLHNLRSVLSLESQRDKQPRAVFSAGDITDAYTLDPFSHIYSFDVGFPPDVMDKMAEIFNRSSAQYLISFHAPRKITDMYGFRVENIGRVATSMAGSSEGHQCYFYRRVDPSSSDEEEAEDSGCVEVPVPVTPPPSRDGKTQAPVAVDPLFRQGFELLKRDREGLLEWIVDFFGREVYAGRTRGQKARQRERPIESYYRVVRKPRAAGTTKKLASPVKKPRKPRAVRRLVHETHD